jgi:hypothetical protein
MLRMKAAIFSLSLAVFLVPCYGQQDPKVEKRVAVLIEGMLNSSTEHKAFADVEALGCAAVPAIIERMDDRRDLPDQHISLRNKSPDAWEAMRHYGVEKAVDALNAILNQMTGESFGWVDTNKDERTKNAERAKLVRGWRDWLKRTPPTKLCEHG